MLRTFKEIPYKLDIFIITTVLVTSIIEHVHIDTLLYRGGLRNSPSWGFMVIFLYEPFKISVLLFAIIRIFFHLEPVQKLRRYITTALLSILIFIASWILLFTCHPPGAVFFLKGYEKWIAKNVDVKAIQTWLLSGDADKYLDRRYRYNFPDDFPVYITDFEPKFVIFHGHESEKGKCIEFGWGGGLAYWGVVVGPPTMKTKQEGRFEEPGSSYVEYRCPIIPGVYIFNGG
jgi:hypothetical protein